MNSLIHHKSDLQMDFEKRELILDYLGGFNALIRGSEKDQTQD